MMTEEQVIELSRKYADKAGIQLNLDQHIVDMVVKGLVENEKKHGFRYCPCRLVTGDKEKDRLIICPCVYHKKEIREDGHCHCMLFVAKQQGQ